MYGQPPVIIEPYNPVWPTRFEIERCVLLPVLAPWLIGPLEHVGSTAVPGLQAKPIIDIMAAVHDLSSSIPAIEALKPLDYCYFDYKADVMHWFCKPSDSERTHHLHLVPFGSRLWRDRLAFRDRLRSDGTVRAAYEALKVALASRYREDREAYTEAKTEFVQSVLGQTSA
ncbi:MAG: GrpB family protein [Steroidobacteraceae bacterium]